MARVEVAECLLVLVQSFLLSTELSKPSEDQQILTVVTPTPGDDLYRAAALVFRH